MEHYEELLEKKEELLEEKEELKEKEELEEKEELRRSQDNIESSEKIKESRLQVGELQNGLEDLQSKFQKILSSPAILFLRNSVDITTNRTYSCIFALLQEALTVPTLLNVDDSLDVNAFASSDFSKRLQELGPEVFGSPFHYLWSGIFFLGRKGTDVLSKSVNYQFLHPDTPKLHLAPHSSFEVIFFLLHQQVSSLVIIDKRRALHLVVTSFVMSPDELGKAKPWLNQLSDTKLETIIGALGVLVNFDLGNPFLGNSDEIDNESLLASVKKISYHLHYLLNVSVTEFIVPYTFL